MSYGVDIMSILIKKVIVVKQELNTIQKEPSTLQWCHMSIKASERRAWWRHQMEIFSVLLAICAENSPVTGEFSIERPVMRDFDVFFDLCLNKWLSKQSWGWWFEMSSRPLCCHCNVKAAVAQLFVQQLVEANITDPLWGESTGGWWIPSQRASNAESMFISQNRHEPASSRKIILISALWKHKLNIQDYLLCLFIRSNQTHWEIVTS